MSVTDAVPDATRADPVGVVTWTVAAVWGLLAVTLGGVRLYTAWNDHRDWQQLTARLADAPSGTEVSTFAPVPIGVLLLDWLAGLLWLGLTVTLVTLAILRRVRPGGRTQDLAAIVLVVLAAVVAVAALRGGADYRPLDQQLVTRRLIGGVLLVISGLTAVVLAWRGLRDPRP